MKTIRFRTIVRSITFASLLLSAPFASASTAVETAQSTDTPFTLSVGNATSKVGAPTTITVTVKAASGFKSNTQYPHKIKALAADGADVPSKVKGAATGKTISYSIPVKPTRAGSHSVTGQIRFSVCSAAQCITKQMPLNATVTGT